MFEKVETKKELLRGEPCAVAEGLLDAMPVSEQLFIQLLVRDAETARRIMPEHPVFAEEGHMSFQWLGGECPVLVKGAFSGNPFFFRARHGEWRLRIGAEDEEASIIMTGKDDTAGFMPDEDVLDLLRFGARLVAYLEREGVSLPDAELRRQEPSPAASRELASSASGSSPQQRTASRTSRQRRAP